MDEVQISYEARGEGSPALLFVHGWSCDRTYWDGQAPYFSKQYRVVTVDLAGHGESGSNRSSWSIGAFAEDVVAVARALDLRQVVLVGHSMGGPVVLEAALLMPNRTLGVVGVDTFFDGWANATPETRDEWIANFRTSFAEWTRNWVRDGMFEPTSDPKLADRIANDMAAAHPEVGVGAMEAVYNWGINDFRRAFKELQAPLRIIQAERASGRLNVVRSLGTAPPSFGVMLMPGVGHFVMKEDPTEFNQLLDKAVKEFMETQRPR